MLYRYRWEIELLFRTLKCDLEIDHFLGSSLNAIYCQLYTALIYHYLLLVIKSQTYCDLSIGQIIKIANGAYGGSKPEVMARHELASNIISSFPRQQK